MRISKITRYGKTGYIIKFLGGSSTIVDNAHGTGRRKFRIIKNDNLLIEQFYNGKYPAPGNPKTIIKKGLVKISELDGIMEINVSTEDYEAIKNLRCFCTNKIAS